MMVRDRRLSRVGPRLWGWQLGRVGPQNVRVA